jgi:hypothetical protein
MHVIGETLPPAKLLKGLAVIAKHLHPEFGRNARLVPGISRRSCVLASLAVQDFLQEIGIRTEVRPCAFVVQAAEGDKVLHSLGMGKPFDPRATTHKDWVGHMVATAEGFLIDTTLYPVADRPAWRHHLPPMLAVQMNGGTTLWDLPRMASLGVDEGDYWLGVAWLDNGPDASWRQGGDARDVTRREKVVRRLVRRFGAWEEGS